MPPPQVDYDALAKQHGGQPVDYDAIAAEVSATPVTVAPATLARPPAVAPAARRLGGIDELAAVGQAGIGALKGVANTVIGLGELVHKIPGVSQAVDVAYGTPGLSQESFRQARAVVQPTNTAQQVGYTGEQIGEFFIPVSKTAKLAKVPEIIKSALLGTAQGGPVAGGTSAALTAVLPGAKSAKAASEFVERSAQKSVAQALGATKEWAKSEAAKLAPEVIARGVKGSRPAMQAQAVEMSQQVGSKLGQLYQQAGQHGKTISGLVIRGELQLAKEALMVPAKTGKLIPIAETEPVLRKLEKLERFVEQLGDDVPAQHAAKIKTAWDRIVAKSGLYGPKASASATDSASAWAIREGAGSFRQLLSDVSPDIAALNKEYAFWTGLRKVLRETEQRTQAQGTGLVSSIVGSGAGTMTGVTTALLGGGGTTALSSAALAGYTAKQLTRLVQSPYWKTAVSAPMKQELAKALAAGSTTGAGAIIKQMIAALPSQARQAIQK